MWNLEMGDVKGHPPCENRIYKSRRKASTISEVSEHPRFRPDPAILIVQEKLKTETGNGASTH